MSSDAAHPGRLTVHLQPGQQLGPARVPGADLVLGVRSGDVLVHLAPGTDPGAATGGAATGGAALHVGTGAAVPLTRGTPFAVRAGADGATLEVTARPPGPEAFVALAARRPPPPLAALVAAAVERGVELLPTGLDAAGESGEAAR